MKREIDKSYITCYTTKKEFKNKTKNIKSTYSRKKFYCFYFRKNLRETTCI